MAKVEIKPNPRVRQIFQDLESYLEFCKNFGYLYDEKDLYSTKSYDYRQYQKFAAGKSVKNNWDLDAPRRT